MGKKSSGPINLFHLEQYFHLREMETIVVFKTIYPKPVQSLHLLPKIDKMYKINLYQSDTVVKEKKMKSTL